MAARRRVAVIDDADRMSNESANALLKTLEEPPSYAVIVLIAADASKILPTIRSRCRTVRFQPLEPLEVARLVTELEWAEDPQAAEAAAALSGGSLAVAQQLLNADLRTMRTALFSGLSKPAFQPFTIAQNVLAALDATRRRYATPTHPCAMRHAIRDRFLRGCPAAVVPRPVRRSEKRGGGAVLAAVCGPGARDGRTHRPGDRPLRSMRKSNSAATSRFRSASRPSSATSPR